MTYSSVVDKLHEAKRAYLGIVVVGGGGGGEANALCAITWISLCFTPEIMIPINTVNLNIFSAYIGPTCSFGGFS